jgi:hypothetical protein
MMRVAGPIFVNTSNRHPRPSIAMHAEVRDVKHALSNMREGNESVPEGSCRLKHMSHSVPFSPHTFRESSPAAYVHAQECLGLRRARVGVRL